VISKARTWIAAGRMSIPCVTENEAHAGRVELPDVAEQIERAAPKRSSFHTSTTSTAPRCAASSTRTRPGRSLLAPFARLAHVEHDVRPMRALRAQLAPAAWGFWSTVETRW